MNLAARAEIHSQHPLALAIVDRAGLDRSVGDESEDFEPLAGRGVRARWSEHEVPVGSQRLFDDFEIPVSPESMRAAEAIGEAETLVLVGVIWCRASPPGSARCVEHAAKSRR